MKKLSLLLTFAVLTSSAYAATGKTETLPSGVTVTQIKEGTGAQPTASDTVTVNYRGTLANGTEFDSSYKRGTPASFPLGQVIPCWTQGLQKMKVGGKATLTCPSATAYGERGVGPIPPNSDLTFEVELLKIGN
ncbi:FKBP-type peptidyl-prolyl cis-trans isomerase [Pararobbsia alpina]|uniref:Peptidyl-prolyl cis-trans isomerase n=1 Tax=Pararobbsia alpina TaxID=621374 RepID=A0A6S7CQD3_9BURK|nr:FKBP-type peptidyl-prolyl cis-trans isomerase [Pararobbsia alpina]CAB3795229.1 putative FKBP-type peptidyl-prolyl cis-trans isomerase FkpA [Pararobbsia alpina]